MPSSNKNNDPSQIDQNEPEPQQTDNFDQSFNMSEMLHYKPEERPIEQLTSEPSLVEEQFKQELPAAIPLSNTADHVVIHDDLAISDSDEDENNQERERKGNSEHENDEDGDGLWF